jgi:RND superfamily putative drug exporter
VTVLARFVTTRRWWVIGAWLVLAVAGGLAAPHATSALSYDFGLPGQPGYVANQAIAAQFHGTGGENAPVLMAVTGHGRAVPRSAARQVGALAAAAAPGARIATWG